MNPLHLAPETAFDLMTLLIRLGLIVLGAVITVRVVGVLIKGIERAIRDDPRGGAQSLVRDWIAGYTIIRDNQLAVGDVVRVAGVSGTVEVLSLRHSEIRDGDGSLHFVPNGEIKVVTNLSKTWSSPTVRIPVNLTENPARAIEEMRAMLAEFSENPEVKPHLLEPARVLGIEDVSAGQFTLLLQARTSPEQRPHVSRAMRLAALERLRGAGITLHTAAGGQAGPPTGVD